MRNYFRVLFDNVPWVSIETDGWLSNPGNDSICVILNFINKNIQKIAIPIHYKFAVHKIKPFHGDILEEVAIERHMSHFVTSCCTDNASNVLGATEKLLTDKNFSAFSIHPECAIHQIQLFAKDLIDDMEGIFKRYSASSLNVTDTIETELRIDDIAAHDIIRMLKELSIYTHNHGQVRALFLKYVKTLPKKYFPTR